LSSTAADYTPAKEDTQKPKRTQEEKERIAAQIASRISAASKDTFETCHKCTKRVYLAERKVVTVGEKKELFHNNCFRCSDCNVLLELHTYGSANGVIYCPAHIKDHVNLSKWVGPQATSNNFVPLEKAQTTERRESSEATMERVRKMKEGADSNKCTVCSKNVYLAEKMDIEIKGEKKLFHKFCFKCSVCSKSLELRTFDSLDGILYCKPHLPSMQQAKNAFMLSPLHVGTDEMLAKLSIDRVEGQLDTLTSVDQPVKNVDEHAKHEEPVHQQPQQPTPVAAEPPKVEESKPKELSEEEQREEERKKRREEREKKRLEDEKQAEEEKIKREKQREERKNRTSDNSNEDPEERDRKQREERKKQKEEESKKEAEESEKKAEERKKRLEQIKKERANRHSKIKIF